MIFGSLPYLLGTLAIAGPIILHLIKNKPKETRTFPSLMFLNVTEMKQSKSNQIYRWILILLRCLILIVLALAFSWPYIPRFQGNADEFTAVLLDESYSMLARPYRDQLKSRLEETLHSASEKSQMLLAYISDKVEWSGDFMTSGEALISQSRQRPYYMGESHLELAIRQAEKKLLETPTGVRKIVIFTDRQKGPWEKVDFFRLLSAGIEMEVIYPEKAGFENVKILSVKQQTPFYSKEQRLELKAVLENRIERNTDVNVNLYISGKLVGSKNVQIAATRQKEVQFDYKVNEFKFHGGKIEIDCGDDIQEDNFRHFHISPLQGKSVCIDKLRGSGFDYLKEIFQLNGQNKEFNIKLLSEYPKEWPEVVFIRQPSILSQKSLNYLEEALQNGSWIFVFCDKPVNWLKKYDIQFRPFLSGLSKHFTNIEYENTPFQIFKEGHRSQLYKIKFYSACEILSHSAKVIASFDQEKAALVEKDYGQGKIFVLGSGITRLNTNWPTLSSFLPFLREVVEARSSIDEIRSEYQVSKLPIVLEEPMSCIDLNSEKEIEKENISFVPKHPGSYLFKGQHLSRAISVNPPNHEGNSNILIDDDKWEKMIVEGEAMEVVDTEIPRSDHQKENFFFILFTLAILLSVFELVLSNRTVL